MRIRVDMSVLRRTTWQEYTVRFLFGGATTVFAGLVARKWGPTIGGLFLAFPAIFPASATLIEKHECQRKQQAGVNPGTRGRQAAAVDAAGAAIGAIGLLIFALVVWQALPRINVVLALAGATIAWFAVSAGVFAVRPYLIPKAIRKHRPVRDGGGGARRSRRQEKRE
jgi:hypothetical protein